jgi:hypothetical protein
MRRQSLYQKNQIDRQGAPVACQDVDEFLLSSRKPLLVLILKGFSYVYVWHIFLEMMKGFFSYVLLPYAS